MRSPKPLFPPQCLRASVVTSFIPVLLAALSLAADKPAAPTPLFNGKDLTGWHVLDKSKSALWSVVEKVELDPKNPKSLKATGQPKDASGILLARLKDFQGTNLVSDQKFKDFTLHVEFLLPKDGNSGLFLMGLYELQLTDSLGIADDKMQEGDHGGIPFFKKPLTNTSGKPGEWQTADIIFQAPRFDEKGKKTTNAKIIQANLNGKTVQKNLELPEPTGGGIDAPEPSTGPLMLQGNESTVAFRNITITPAP